jgi:hypothetical protein
MMHLSNPVEKGTRLDLFILLPFKGNKWMKYSAHVIRIEDGVPEFNRPECVGPRFVGPRFVGPRFVGPRFGAAVKFKVARPEFATK